MISGYLQPVPHGDMAWALGLPLQAAIESGRPSPTPHQKVPRKYILSWPSCLFGNRASFMTCATILCVRNNNYAV